MQLFKNVFPRALLGFGVVLCLGASASAGPFTDPGHDPLGMSAWASAVHDVERGPMDIAAPGLGLASFGVPENALGAATSDSYFVYSLGDGGFITFYFDGGIGDGAGDDFAVFENGFFAPGGLFGELAFVDVSSNGVDFARFESESLRASAVDTGEVIDPTDFGNLAGDQPLGSGTGFDLSELWGHELVSAGLLDLEDVRYVRIVDVIGNGTTFDAMGFPIYDPYPTAFASGGFDVEAVGVVNEAPEPSMSSLLLAGLASLIFESRRRGRGDSCAG